MVIRSHQTLEALLLLLLNECLQKPGELDLSRLSFHLKVDLAVALGKLPPESRPLLVKLNALRNRFAHQEARFTRASAREMYNCLSAGHRTTLRKALLDYTSPISLLEECFAVSFVELKHLVSATRDAKARERALSDMVAEVLGALPKSLERQGSTEVTNEQVRKAVESDRQARARACRL